MVTAVLLRFDTVLRERSRPDGETDRYWCVTDRKYRGFLVLKVNASYPGAEDVARNYASRLNAKWLKERDQN